MLLVASLRWFLLYQDKNYMYLTTVSFLSGVLSIGVTQFMPMDISIHDFIAETSQNEVVEDYVDEYFSHIPVMSRIAYCESTYRHFGDSGEVLRGIVDPRDVGVMQINEHYHLDTSKRFGFNIHTLEGNLGYAENLYNRQGTQPWSASKDCWNRNYIAQR
jgi:hypothetical protein